MERPQHYRFHQGEKALPFADAEYEARLGKLRATMADQGIDACVLTSMHNVAYYSGFLWVRGQHHLYGLAAEQLLACYPVGDRVW